MDELANIFDAFRFDVGAVVRHKADGTRMVVMSQGLRRYGPFAAVREYWCRGFQAGGAEVSGPALECELEPNEPPAGAG